jgi:hypothetical protein
MLRFLNLMLSPLWHGSMGMATSSSPMNAGVVLALYVKQKVWSTCPVSHVLFFLRLS